MLTTRGIGGQSQCVPTGGYGSYLFGDIEQPDEEGDEFGGEQKYEVAPRRIYMSEKVSPPTLTDENVFVSHETLESLAETVIEVEGDDYRLAIGEMPTGKMAVAELPAEVLESRLKAIQKEWNIPKREAFVKLAARADKELKATKALKESMVNDDEEFMFILMAADA